MTNFIVKAAIAAIVAFGTIGGIAADASAAQVEVIIKKPVRKPVIVVRPRVVVVRPRVVVRKPVIVVRPAVIRRPVVIVRPAPVVVIQAGRCSRNLALTKASNSGLNRVAIAAIGPNRVVVSGKARGMWMKMTFANVAGCPRL